MAFVPDDLLIHPPIPFSELKPGHGMGWIPIGKVAVSSDKRLFVNPDCIVVFDGRSDDARIGVKGVGVHAFDVDLSKIRRSGDRLALTDRTAGDFQQAGWSQPKSILGESAPGGDT